MANGIELGKAYISILAETSKIAPAVKRQFNAIDSDAGKLGARIGTQISSKLKTTLKVGAGALAGLTALVGGMAIKGGIDRALKIDTAQAKLRGLGHDADSVQAIMKNALASVKGTSFGLGEAAVTAAGAVAAGIQPGERLESVLKSVANSASAAGVDMGEMGGIFNKVASLGKAQNDVLQQVADRGIPIYQALGKQMGMTVEEVFNAASKGKISFEQFEAAMREASGTVATEMGQTLPGKIENFKAALSRLGESVVSQVLPHLADGFSWLTEKADALGPVAKQVGEALGNAVGLVGPALRDQLIPAVQEASTWFKDTLVPALQDAVSWVKENATWLGPLAAAVTAGMTAWYGYAAAVALAKTVAGGFSSIGSGLISVVTGFNAALAANPIGAVITAIAALTAGLVYFFTQTEVGKAAWEAIWNGIKTAVAVVVEWWNSYVAPAFAVVWDLIVQGAQAAWDGMKAAWDGIMAAAKPVIDWFNQYVTPIFVALGDLVVAIWQERIAPAIEFGMGLFRTIGEVLGAVWNTVIKPVLDVMAATWQLVWDNIMAVWNAVGQPVATAIGAAFNVAKAIFEGAMQAIGAVVDAVWNTIKGVIETVLQIIHNAIQTVTAAIRGDWEGVWEGIKNHFTILWEGIVQYFQNVLNGMLGFFGGWFAGMSGAWNAAWQGILDFFGAIWMAMSELATNTLTNMWNFIDSVCQAIVNAWNAFWEGVKNIGSAAWDWISSTLSAVFQAIKTNLEGIWNGLRTAWDGFWGGLKSAGETAWNWIRDTVNGVWDGIKKYAEDTWTAMVTAIGTAWDKIKETVAKPINAVIGFINDGIIGSYNWVADKIKIVPKIDGRVEPVKFARGGILPGQSSWRQGDDQLTWMRRGEGVTVSEALRDPYERRRLLALNRAALNGMSAAQFRRRFEGHGIEHHATGGIVGFRGHRFTSTFAARILQAEKLAGGQMHITQGGWRPRTSYSGTSHAGDALDITGNYRRFIAPLRRVGIATWDRAGKGNWVAHAHGVPLPGHGTAGGSAIWQAQDYLRGGDGLGGRDNGPRVGVSVGDVQEAVEKGADKNWWESLAGSVGETWDKIKNWFSELGDKIMGPLKALRGIATGDGPFDNLVGKLAEKLGRDLKNWAAEKLGLPKDEGYARGTRNARPGWAWVGENGPELVNFRGGEQVLPHHESITAGQGVTIHNMELQLPDWVDDFDDVVRFLASFRRQVSYA